MKIFLKFPGGELYLEREPMTGAKFEAVCVLAGLALAGLVIVSVIALAG